LRGVQTRIEFGDMAKLALHIQPFALRVELTQLDRVGSGQLVCKVAITMSSQNGTQSQASGRASVSWNPNGGNRYAAGDCVDAIVENLLVIKVIPALQVANSTPAPAVAAPAPAASSPATGSSTPVPGSPNNGHDDEDSAR
jgi:hypothetical protein